jgi:16S rRNA (guanine966-N2)-methyltransferase
MRIVGGRWRGRPIRGPGSRAIRPTSDRLRETIFNVLEHAYGDPVTDARVLDLFAGTGAMGLESLSRGAAFSLFIDHAVEARALIRASIETLGCGGQARIFRRDATRLGEAKGMDPFALVFCDPPYGHDLAQRALSAALAGGWLAKDALVIVEEEADMAFAFPEGFAEAERRIYGDTLIVIAKASIEASSPR